MSFRHARPNHPPRRMNPPTARSAPSRPVRPWKRNSFRRRVVPPCCAGALHGAPVSKRRSTHMTVQTETSQEATVAQGIILTAEAAAKVKSLLEQEGRDDLSLRVAVQPGGCSGLRYQLYFDDRSLDGDVVAGFDGVNVVTDRMSAPYLAGATVDF